MRNSLLLLLFVLAACAKKEAQIRPAKAAMAEDSVVAILPAVGAGTDSHGCKASAGYTWSSLKGECIRIFEAGTMLNPYNDPTGAQMAAFVVFDGDKAEVFMQTERPMVLQRKTEGGTFTAGPWQLVPWKGYVLKKNGTILFTGQ